MKTIDNEKGAVLVVSLIVLGLLMVIGTAITMSSSIELKIARNEKVGQNAFYRAENGRILAARITRSVLSGGSFADESNFDGNPNIWVMDGDFPMENIDDGDTFSDSTADVKMTDDASPPTPANTIASVDVDKIGVGPLPGSSAEFGSGYEGVGKAGSAQVIYRMDSEGMAAANARSRVVVEYRMVR